MIKKTTIALITISTGLLLNSLAYATDATTTNQTPANTATTTNTGTTNPIAPSAPPSASTSPSTKPEPSSKLKPKKEAPQPAAYRASDKLLTAPNLIVTLVFML